MHLSVFIQLKLQSVKVSESSCQNRSADWSVPYSDFVNFTYNIGLPFLFSHMYFLYRLGSNFKISLAMVPSSNMCMSSSMSARRKAPGISVTATCLPSISLIAHDIIMASSDTVGQLVSAIVVYSHWLLPLAHLLALMVPSRFSFKNIRYLNPFFLSSYVMSSFFWAVAHFFHVADLAPLVLCHFNFLRIFLCLLLCPLDLALHVGVAWQ